MKKTIYFHIGFPKTGTTSLQSFCYKNSKILEKHGFLYPVIENYSDPTVIINGKILRRELIKIIGKNDNPEWIAKNKEKIKAKIRPLWQKMKRKIDASKADKILISCEGFVESKFVFWEFVDHADFDIKVVVYVRNIYDQMISWYKQKAKDNYIGDYPLNIIEYFATPSVHSVYHEAINSYGDYLGVENVFVRVYEKESLTNGNTIDDFFEMINFKLPQNLPESIYINTSFSHDTIVICGFIKTLFAAINYNQGYYPIYELSMADVGNQNTAHLLPDNLIQEICNKYYEKDCQIAQRFLGRDELFKDKYPAIYYDKQPTQNLQYVMVSYEQLNILYDALGKSFEHKLRILKPFIYFICFFIPSSNARKKIKSKYLAKRYGVHKKMSFSGFSGSI